MKQLLMACGIMLLLSSNVIAQSVTGTVTDASTGETLPGVNIIVKGTTTGTSTNSNGSYELTVPSLQDTLVFSFIGFETQQIPVSGRTEINVEMELQAIAGEELVVVGYGTVKEKDLTGSVASVDGEQFQTVPVASFIEALQGNVAGVQIKNTSGAKPGGEMQIRIRGFSSINSSGGPLYVVDGFPGVGDLSTINPNNIESIEILKDASATAIYGARGANGVVLITTKQGRPGETAVNLNYSIGLQNVYKRYDLLNATEFAKYTNTVREASGSPPIFTDPASFGKGTDWQAELFRPAPIQNVHLSVRGGNLNTTYALSGGFFSQEGVVIGSGLNRGSFRVNLESDLSEDLTASASVYIAETKEDLDNPDATTAALTISPIASVRDENGTYLTNADLAAYYGFPFYSKGNPVAMAKDIIDTNRRTHLIGNGYLEYDISNNLTFKTSFGADINYGEYNYYVPDGTPNAGNINIGGTAQISTSKYLSWINENTLTYNQDFKNHSINLLAGATFQEMNYSNVTASAENFTDDFYKFNNLGLGGVQKPSASSTDGWFLNSYFIRANYQFSDRYLATFTTRVDGSSKFGKNNKYGFFPSGALAWRISDESFVQDWEFLSNLKLRVSYGITGNQGIGSYQSLARIGGAQYIFGGERAVGAAPRSIANKNLKWEKTSQFDVGVDVGFFENRLSFTADYYRKVTSDLLLALKVPYTSGFSTSLQNIGKVSNRGVELSINSVNIRQEELFWETGFNISFNKNEVLDLGATDEIISNGHLWFFGSYSIAREGYPVGMFYNYEFDGIWQIDDDITNSAQPGAQPGDPKFVDQNNDGVINADDRTIIGNPHPDFLFGFTSNLNWKNFDLNIQVHGSYGNDIMNASYIDVMFPNATTNITSEYYSNIWTPENRSNTHMRAGSDIDPSSSSRYLEDGSYLKIDNVTLGYSLPAPVLNKMSIERLRLYVSVQNLYTFTNYSGYNPEANLYGNDNLRLGYDYSYYPMARTINVGINLKF